MAPVKKTKIAADKVEEATAAPAPEVAKEEELPIEVKVVRTKADLDSIPGMTAEIKDNFVDHPATKCLLIKNGEMFKLPNTEQMISMRPMKDNDKVVQIACFNWNPLYSVRHPYFDDVLRRYSIDNDPEDADVVSTWAEFFAFLSKPEFIDALYLIPGVKPTLNDKYIILCHKFPIVEISTPPVAEPK